MKHRNLFLLGLLVIVSTGCETMDKQRREKYINMHPDMSVEQKSLMYKGRLWVGMSMDEVRASLGEPSRTQKEILNEKEVWSYAEQEVLTTHRDYNFDTVLRLEFFEGRLANWRED
jgi:hypothetical protein